MKKCKFMMAILGAMILFSPILAEDLDESSGESSAPVASSGVPKPGNGVATFLGGTAVQKGDGAIVLNYNFTQAYNGGNKIYRNNFVPVLRMGLGDKWDINIVVPQMYQVQKGGKQGAMYGSTGVVELIIHKQHLAEQVGESTIMLASNWIITAPTTAGMNGAWGFGFDLGLTWLYDSMRFVFDFRANTNSQTANNGAFKNPSISVKAGYHYAFIDYLYAGLELNYDTIFYRTASRTYNADGSHILYVGPMLGVKIPELKGASWGVGFFWDCLNRYQHSTPSTNLTKVDSWRITSRVTAVF